VVRPSGMASRRLSRHDMAGRAGRWPALLPFRVAVREGARWTTDVELSEGGALPKLSEDCSLWKLSEIPLNGLKLSGVSSA